MGSLGSGELIVIALVALIVFGPKRLPELARKASELLSKTREATKSVTDALDIEYDGITAPIQDLKQEYDSTVKGFKDAASSVTDFSVDMTSTLPGEKTDSPSSNESTAGIGEPDETIQRGDETISPDESDHESEPEPESDT